MKRLLLILSAIFIFVAAQAQTILEDGDYVTISFIANDFRFYLEASGDGLRTTNTISDHCLWEMKIVDGKYRLRDLTTGKYLRCDFTDPSNSSLILTNETSADAFSFADKGSKEGVYMQGHFYVSHYYAPWHGTFAIYLDMHWINNSPNFVFHSWNTQCTPLIEKWEQKGAGNPTGHFSPSKIEFSYIGDQEGEAEKDDDPREVQFVIESTTESYYQCINRPEEALLLRSTGNVDGGNVSIQNVYWESTGANKSKSSVLDKSKYIKYTQDRVENRELMTITHENGAKTFTITPIGNSPMDLKQLVYKEVIDGQIVGVEQWVDYDDDVVVEYTYGNGEVQTAKMRVVRKAYHEEEVPSMVFSINPATYTFATGAEEKDFDVVATHQHGAVIYNVDGQVIKENYTTKENISFNNNQLDLVFGFENENAWKNGETLQITATKNGDHKVKVSVSKNETRAKRSAILTGTLHPNQATGTHKPVPFTIQLHQRGVDAGGIQFVHQMGAGNTEWGKNTNIDGTDEERREQLVHTSERTIYYESGQQEIELRLPEAGYSGYMRWYDYQTGGDPYYNYARGKASTSWVRSPRGFNDVVFSAINTPRNGDDETIQQEGYSHGLYSFNKADGGVLDEANPYNPMPIIKGWTYDNAADACHIMACDVSAYTDYKVVRDENQIKSITEPTLSYRQLFHLRPASEMAAKLADLGNDEYLEEYHYIAPAGKQILLSTEYRHSKVRSHMSELCYFYWNGESLARVNGNVVWKRNGETHTPTYTAELDYLIVRSEVPGKDVYTLEVESTGQRIARFVVEFVDVEKYGPTNKTIITKQKIQNDYEIRELIDFNYTSNKDLAIERVTMNDGTVHINQHLPWEQSTYGYVYPSNTNYKRGASQGAFPFYGEYSIVNEVKKDWARGEQLGGKDKGFAMYIDGTMEPGLVASIEANANICEGQTMYCSAWLCNPTPAGWSGEGNPIFRCNVEGLNDGIWTNIETYFVGELLKGSGWQQVVFPIKSNESYDKVRVSIYNFATTNQGNDFMVDDICLYVSQLPIASYRGEMACKSNNDESAQGIAVLRIDYSKMDESSAGHIYYQIFNETYSETTTEGNTITGKPVTLGNNNIGYYHDIRNVDNEEHTHSYGSISIPKANHIPPQDSICLSVSKLIDKLMTSTEIHMKAYIKINNDNVDKYLLYVVHKIEHTGEENEALIKLYEDHDYTMRMANTVDELADPECNMQTPIHATQQTLFHLHNSDGNKIGEDFSHHSQGNCANDLYFLTIKIKNTFAAAGGGNLNNVEAPIYADWLVGDEWDDVYREDKPTDVSDLESYKNRLADADEKFQNKYGYTRGQVTTAIMYDMRRIPIAGDDNSTNYNAKSFNELDPNAFLSHQNYTIVKHLCDNGWLQLHNTTTHFYLGPKTTARYWAFPIEGTAKTKIEVDGKQQEYTLLDCNEPRWVTVSSVDSEYHMNIAPIKNSEKNYQQKTQIPTVKVPANRLSQVSIPIIERNRTTVQGQNQENIAITLDLTQQFGTDGSFYSLEAGKTESEPSSFPPGSEYTIRLNLKDGSSSHVDGTTSSCLIGYVFATIQIVPETMVWKPTGNSFNGWGKDENWKGWVDSNENNQIDEGELVKGYVPMSETNVIIPQLDNPLLYPYIVPEDEHSHYPMTVGFEPHHCNNIYFEPEAKIHNQHLLQYNKAFVDMQVTAASWNMVAAPLQGMVSGDMFIPHKGWWSESENHLIPEPNPFEVNSFRGIRSGDAAYAFWQAFYNTTVNKMTNNGLVDVTAGAEFVQSNTLIQELNPGAGYQLYGLGWKDKEPLTIRLPKPDTEYYYYNGKGDVYGNPVQIPTANRNKLAFTPTNNATDAMDITLTNKTASQYFLFGNPTMAYINMHDFLHDNEGEENNKILNHVFYRIENGTWDATTEHTMGNDRFLAPMTSVMLEASTACTALPLTLKASHLTLNNQVSPFSEDNPAVQQAPRRAPSADEPAPTSELLTIYALTKNATARTVLATNPVANDYYLSGEDALFISTGVENESYVTTPLNMYTVAERVPMMADVRQGISNIPLAILAADKARQEYMQLAFYYTSNWSRTCYFCDSKTGQKIRIMNGLVISVEMPQNHEQRYFIEGPDSYLGSGNSNGNGTSTAVDNTHATAASLHAYSQDKGQLTVVANQPIRELKVYSITGQLLSYPISTHDCQLSTVNCQQLPTGVCIVEATLYNGTTLHTQAVVK